MTGDVRRRCFLILFTATALAWWALHARAEEITDIGELQRLVLKHEQRYSNLTAEITRFHWADAADKPSRSSEARRIIQWNETFFESGYKNNFSGKFEPAAFRFIWCDGKTKTVYSPPDIVRRYSGEFPSPERFRPYAMVLQALGYDGTLSRFLLEVNQSFTLMQVKIIGSGMENGLRTLEVRGSRGLPGSRFARIIGLRLAIDHGYLPCWGQRGEIEGDDVRSDVVVKAPSFVEISDGLPLMRELELTRFPDSLTGAPESIEVVQLRANLLTQKPAEDVFKPREFLGNPKIHDYQNGESIAERLYHPRPVKKSKPWPPVISWLCFNALLLSVITVYYLLRLARFAVPLQFRWSLK